MIGRAAVVVLLSSFTFTQAVIGQCNYQPARSFQFRSSVFDVAVEGSDVLAANGYGIAAYTGTSVAQTLALPGTTRVVRIFNGYVFAGSGTSIFTINRPTLAIAGAADTGATVNDILGAGSFLYVATSNGLQQFDISAPSRPTRTAATFATSGTNVTSLAVDANTLYAADSDNSVEVFSIANPASPQKTGAIASLPRVTSVKVFEGQLLASDGVQTDVFSLSGTPAKIATLPFGTNAFTVIGAEIVAAAGTDRRLHVVDLSRVGAPVELFAADLIPSGGTINRIGGLAKSGNQLYVGSGDLGLQMYDLTGFAPPYPLRSYRIGSTSSVATTSTRIYAALLSGGIQELGIASSGDVTPLRQWDTRQDIVRDVDSNGFLLTSSGSTLTLWTLASSQPTAVSTAGFKSPVASAVISKNSAYAVLSDQTIWMVDVSVASPQPVQLTTNAQSPGLIARSGSSIAIADLRADGTTSIVNYKNGSTLEIPRTASVPGIATALAHGGNLAAVFTFRGITVADLAAGTQVVMSQSTSIPTSLAIDGTNVLAATSSALTVWNAKTGAIVRTIPLPSAAARIAIPDPPNGSAAIATADGVTTVAYNTSTRLPAPIPVVTSNAYYKKVLAAKNRLYLFDGRGADVFETAAGLTPHFITRIAPPAVVDVAAGDAGLYALAGDGVVYAYGADGTLITQRNVANTIGDTQPLAIAVVAGAPWVSVSQQCRTGTCQNNTLVLDPLSLAQTAILTGGIVDVTTSGSRAYAITSVPSEVRVIDVSAPQHPVQVSARVTEGTPAPVSIAYAAGTVFVLGDKLYSYAESGLTKVSEQTVAYDPATYADQRIVVSGSCGIVTGRAANPALYTLPSLTGSQSIAVPANVKSIAISGNSVYVLTEDSIEVWSNGTPPPAPRHRAVR